MPSVAWVTMTLCSPLFFGKTCLVEEHNSLSMASQSSHGSKSSLRTTLSKLGALSSTALINTICCSSGLKPTTRSPFSIKFLAELSKSSAQEGLLLSGKVIRLASSSTSQACSRTYICMSNFVIHYSTTRLATRKCVYKLQEKGAQININLTLENHLNM